MEMRAIVQQLISKRIPGYLIVRAQSRREITIKLNNGKIENVATGNESGIGVQAFTLNGASGFASANCIETELADKLAGRALALAEANERAGCELNTQIFSLDANVDDLPCPAEYDFDHFSPEELQEITTAIHRKVKEVQIDGGSIAWQTSYRQIEDYWCIGRTDGTLVSYCIPRTVLFHQGTVRKGEHSQSFSIHRSGVDAGVLSAEKDDEQLHQQAADKAKIIEKVCIAPPIPPGNYPIVIDYGLAKGLAHEAFGHAVESDLVEESVLCENGKLKKGMVISGHGVDILDGSLDGDWAYQPYSANGEKRKTVAVVKDGILRQGLGDVFSAQKAGMEITGAGRAEYYGSIPLPRMTNIRLVTRETFSLPESESLAEEIRNLRKSLKDQGRLEPKGHFLLLGYRGGQVNIKTGDFVFQCDGAVNLAEEELSIYNPGIFSGKILSVLESVKFSLGKAKTDAIGTCGKAGQMVPSSGGGSGYIFLDRNENIRLGGSEIGK